MHYPLKQEVYEELKNMCMETKAKEEKLPATQMAVRLMDMEGLPMHCPYHHFILPAALLTQAAISREKSPEALSAWLEIAEERAKTIPAGLCGECGTCGSAVGIGIFISIYTGATTKSVENWQWANKATGICLQGIAEYPGPRCCKRTAFLALNCGVPYINETCKLNFALEEAVRCKYEHRNPECLQCRCPFYGEK